MGRKVSKTACQIPGGSYTVDHHAVRGECSIHRVRRVLWHRHKIIYHVVVKEVMKYLMTETITQMPMRALCAKSGLWFIFSLAQSPNSASSHVV
jgi:hypothetical protein